MRGGFAGGIEASNELRRADSMAKASVEATSICLIE